MIELTRLNGSTFWLNPDHIWLVESRPDTVITMIQGEKLVVVESAEKVAEKFGHYKMSILNKTNWV